MISEKKLLNKNVLISFIVLMLMFLISWIVESGIIEMIFLFDVNAPDLGGNGVTIREEFIRGTFNPVVAVYDMFTLAGPMIPLIVLIAMRKYFDEYDGYLRYHIGRGNYFSNIRKFIIKNSIYIAISNFIAYFIVIFTLSRFSETGKLTLDESLTIHHFFKNDLFYNYNILYFIVIGFISVFLVSLVTGILIGGLYTFLKSKLKVASIIIIYTYIISLIGRMFEIDLINILLTIRSFDFFGPPFYRLFIPLIIPIIIGGVLLVRKDIYEL